MRKIVVDDETKALVTKLHLEDRLVPWEINKRLSEQYNVKISTSTIKSMLVEWGVYNKSVSDGLKYAGSKRKRSEDTRKRMSEASRKRWSRSDGSIGFQGEHHTVETRAHLSDVIAKDWDKISKEDRPEKLGWTNLSSEDRLKRIDNMFKENTNFIDYYNSPKAGLVGYRSLWERSVFVYLDGNFNVKKYYYERISIPYLNDENKPSLYFPDLLIEYVDGSLEIVEIKPEHRLTGGWGVDLKIDAGKVYAEEHGIKFSVWTEVELKRMDITVGNL